MEQPKQVRTNHNLHLPNYPHGWQIAGKAYGSVPCSVLDCNARCCIQTRTNSIDQTRHSDCSTVTIAGINIPQTPRQKWGCREAQVPEVCCPQYRKAGYAAGWECHTPKPVLPNKFNYNDLTRTPQYCLFHR